MEAMLVERFSERNPRQLEEIVSKPFSGTSWEDFKSRIIEQLKGSAEVSGAELMVASLEALAPENIGIYNIAGHHGGAILPFYEFLGIGRI